jgi:Anti-sigma factor NepR
MTDREQPKPEDPKDPPVQPDVANTASPPPPAGDAAMEPELQAFIGRQLQATYDEVLNEPVPDRFLELLRKLEQDKVDEP